MKDKRSLIKRFIEFQNERLQLGVLIFTTAAVVLSSVAVSLPESSVASNYYSEILISIFTLLVFMFHVRVLDEHKDYEFDAEHHKDRPVQRGLITLRELFIVDVLSIMIILSLNLFFPDRAIFFLILALAYTLFAGKEFFVRDWIRKRFFLYNLLNLLQLLFLQFYLYALINPNFSFENPLLGIHFIFVLFSVGIIEFARKLKSKSEETGANDTYSSRLGIKKAVVIHLAICLAVYGLFIYMFLNLVFSYTILALSLISLNLVLVASILYVSKNNKATSLLLQSFAALFYISMHLLLVFTKL